MCQHGTVLIARELATRRVHAAVPPAPCCGAAYSRVSLSVAANGRCCCASVFSACSVVKARQTSRKVRHGSHKKEIKVRTKTHFYRPKTLKLSRNPKVVRKSVRKTASGLQRLDKYSVVRFPLTTESAMKKIEEDNTLVFIVDKLANKRQIKAAVKGMYEIDCAKVNTLIRCVLHGLCWLNELGWCVWLDPCWVPLASPARLGASARCCAPRGCPCRPSTA